MSAPSKTYKLVFKLAAVVVPLLTAAVGAMYGADLSPIIRDFCEAALPSGTLIHEVDAGAAR